MDFRDQRFLITGGASGIGHAIAWTIAQGGGSVFIADRNEGAANEVAEKLSASGCSARAIHADVADPASVDEMFKAVQKSGKPLDGLAHCAGIGVEKTILETTLEDWNKIIGVNLTGTFLCAKAAAEIMISHGYGRILLMGSAAGERGGSGRTAYGASKGGCTCNDARAGR